MGRVFGPITERGKAKPKHVQQPIRQRKENIIRSQRELLVKTSKLPGAQENASGQVAIGFSFESDRLYIITEYILHSDWNYFRHLIENCSDQ